MENVIEEISKIDKLAFEHEEQNKVILAEEKTKFENEINQYREEQLKAALSLADSTYEGLVAEAKTEAAERKAASEKEIEELNAQFVTVEKNIIEEVFKKLFVSEEGE